MADPDIPIFHSNRWSRS